MPQILPFSAWRYNPDLSPFIDDLTSPLFDVVSEKQRKALYQNPHNSIHLSVPRPPDAADRAAHLLEVWKKTGVILQDALPGIYVYYQYFKLAGAPKASIRKGFICHIRINDFDETIILRH